MPTLPAVPAFLASKRPSISRKRSVGGSSTSTRDLNREEKSAPYEEQRYEEDLQLKGFFMEEHDRGPTPKTTETYKDLFKKTIKLPQHIGFADELFQQTLKDIHGKNVARVIRDIGLLVCPSPEDLFKRGDILTVGLCESVDEAWILTQPILGSRPQPDFSVGFKRQAFTEEQLNKIRPLLGNSEDQASFFRATCALDVADRQNAHSMGIAVRAVVSLFHLANRAKELDGQILAFSLSYNDLNVRIYGYYPKVEGNEVAYYRHPIAYITMQDSNSSKERWKTYRFVRSIYEHWAPAHLKRLRSLLDEIGTVMPAPAEKTGLSQFFASSSIYSDATSVEGLQTKPTTPIELPAPAIPNIFPSSQHGVEIKNTSVKRRASLKLRKR